MPDRNERTARVTRGGPMTYTDQTPWELRCEWGAEGVRHLARLSDAMVIVDVLTFSTCVSIATGRGARVHPFPHDDDARFAFAGSLQAELAGPRGESRYSLSPGTLRQIPAGTRLVLPSPNGSTLTLAIGATPTFAGCLRNCRAVARAARACGLTVAVIPAGERWPGDDSLRPALEDLVGAGAVLSHLEGRPSPEAEIAMAAYRSVAGRLQDVLRECSSGRELRERGFEDDVVLAAELDVDDHAAVLRDGAYVRTGEAVG